MSRALLILDSAANRAKAADWCARLRHGSRVEFKEAKRTLPQNDRLWAMLTEVAMQCPWHGVKLTADDWKFIFLDALKRELRMAPNIDGTGFVNLGRSSSDLSKSEMSDLIELIMMFGAQHGVTFKDTDSNSLQPSVSPDAGADTPAAESSPGPAAAGVPNSSGLPQGWEIRLRAALADAKSPDGLVDAARRCFDKIGARPTDPRDIDTAKAIRKAFEENFGQPDAINDAVRELV